MGEIDFGVCIMVDKNGNKPLRRVAKWLLPSPWMFFGVLPRLGRGARNESQTGISTSGNDFIESPHSDTLPSLPKFSLVKVILASVVAVLFITSVLLNFTYLTKGEPTNSLPSNPFHWILIVGLIVVTTISLVISFWTYYVRSIYVKDGPALVPEQWGKVIGDLIEVWKVHHSQSQSSLEKVRQSSAEHNKKSDDLLESFLTLQKALNARDEEIARLKKGHDAKIFKRFLLRFVRVDRSLREMELESMRKMEHEFSSQENQKNYRYLKRVMQDALEECGVGQFMPEKGVDYREADKVADDPKVVETTNPDEDFKIADIETPAYIIEGEGETEVIAPSKVSIYRYRVNKEEE